MPKLHIGKTKARMASGETDNTERPVLIIGAGVIGLAIGWRLAQAGKAVHLFERGCVGEGTSWLAAGMLAPDAEIGFEELDLYRLNRASLALWPRFATELEAAADYAIDYRTEGTLIVANDRDSTATLRRLYAFQKEQRLDVDWLTGGEALDLEPFLSPRLTAAIFAAGDHQVDNRLLIEALKVAFVKHGGQLHEQTVIQHIAPDAKLPRIRTEEGIDVEGQCIVVAAGVWVQGLGGIEPAQRPSVRPVKGQVIQLKMEQPFGLRHVVRGPDAYLAPKSNGRLVIGATSEEMGFDTRVTAGGLYKILEGAWEVVPGIYDLPVTDTWAGLRPSTLDHAPLLGTGSAPGVLFATGHYRHGILLAPVTAESLCRLILHQETMPLVEPFSPLRFGSAH